jgi:hypothetical protein
MVDANLYVLNQNLNWIHRPTFFFVTGFLYVAAGTITTLEVSFSLSSFSLLFADNLSCFFEGAGGSGRKVGGGSELVEADAEDDDDSECCMGSERGIGNGSWSAMPLSASSRLEEGIMVEDVKNKGTTEGI